MTVLPVDVEREAELRAYDLIDRPALPILERIADLAALVCGTATAEVNVITATHQVHLAASDRNVGRVPKEDSFCARVIGFEDEVVVVPDALADLRFADSPFANGTLGRIKTYAAAKLTAPTGNALGTICVFDDAAVPLSADQLFALQRLAAIVVDVLEARRAEIEVAGTLERLAGSHRVLRTSNESLEAFAGQISHDLQSPLTAVEVALELLEHHVELSGDAQVLLEHARSGARRMQHSITDLLDFAVAGSTRPAVRVEVGSVVAEVLLDLAPGLGTVKVEIDPLPAVLGQESEVRAVLQNLIHNAVKYGAPQDVAQVHLRGEIRGPAARITVADNGPGVAEEYREAVFQHAFRGVVDPSVAGHGIGLATCARIVTARGGRIGVAESETGGAAFWFELPAAH